MREGHVCKVCGEPLIWLPMQKVQYRYCDVDCERADRTDRNTKTKHIERDAIETKHLTRSTEFTKAAI